MTDPYDVVATRLLTAKADPIRRFWEGFRDHADELDGLFSTGEGNLERVSEIMAPLGDIAPELMWEFGPSEKGHNICITAEWRHELRALARGVVNLAPEMDRFMVTDARTGNDPDMLAGNFEARFRIPVTLSDISCMPGIDNKVEMTGTGPGSEDQTGNEVLAIGTFLLGERNDRDWFGDVVAVKAKTGLFGLGRKSQSEFDAAAFVAAFEGVVADITAGLPETRRADASVDGEDRMLMKFNAVADHSGRPDLIVMNAGSEAYVRAAISTTRFSSVNHSKRGEWFAFLRVPRTAETPFEDVGDRYALEEGIHDTLSAAGDGGYMAGGHGREAVYVDIALDQIDSGLAGLAQSLRDRPRFADMTIHFLEAGLPQNGIPLSSFLTAQN